MCFVHDYDWRAERVEEAEFAAVNVIACDECRRKMPPGARMHNTYMQQYEECQDCSHRDRDGDEDGGCECLDPNYGETFDYDCCHDCHRFLGAVQVAEEEEGCSGAETRPGLTEMIETIRDGGLRESKRYFQAAAKLHPELVASGYLGWLWRRMWHVQSRAAS